jgi:catechol 2,3-dioxygenase-like lactoylglutathione lyase family enzyme
MANLELVALVVRDYEPAIRFFVDVLKFELVEDTPSLTNDGRQKRWVVVRPSGAQTGILLARADGEHQVTVIGPAVRGPSWPVRARQAFSCQCQKVADVEC